nr:MAG TPA: hypothetical protein [Caudoviricetes sp.]
MAMETEIIGLHMMNSKRNVKQKRNLKTSNKEF